MSMIPSKTQWKNWSLPSKAGYFGAFVGFISLVLAVIQFIPEPRLILSSETKTQTNVSKLSPSQQRTIKNHRFTYEMYKSIKRGMTYEEVVEITGSVGLEVSYDERFIQYSWDNEDASSILVGFLDGKVVVLQQLFIR